MGLRRGVGALGVDDGPGLGGRGNVPQPGEGVHIEGHIVYLAVEIGDGGIDVVVEAAELVDILPDRLVRGVEDMGAILVDMDALHRVGITVAADVLPALHHQTAFSLLMGLMGKHGTKESGPNNQIVIHSGKSPHSFLVHLFRHF